MYAAASILLAILTSQESNPQQQQQQREIESLVSMHDGWGPARSAPPGFQVHLHEVARDVAAKTVAFEIRATGLPDPMATFDLVEWPATRAKPVTTIKGFSFGSDGFAAGSDGARLRFVSRLEPGEPVRIAVATPGKATVRAFVRFTPLPIAGEDRGCRLSATLLNPAGTILYVEAEGYPAGAPLEIRSVSNEEARKSTAKADAVGRYVTVSLPAVVGSRQGSVKLTIAGPDCAPQVTAKWALP